MASITPRQWERYEQYRQRGWGITQAAREVGVSLTSAKRREGSRSAINPEYRDGKPELQSRAPIPLDEVKPEAKRALEDFGYFQERYMGRLATGWQADAAIQVQEYLASPEKEYVVINVGPGYGKTTTFAHDIPCWLTVKNRAIRGQIGSKTEHGARKYVQRIRRTLERSKPLVAETEDIAKGLALDAVATLADDYGTFKPEVRDEWSSGAFVVAQHGGILIAEKEPTWSAYGMDSGFLGMRYNIVIWDDVVDKIVLRTIESRGNMQEWWDDMAEKRLEPGGLLVLQGQRMGADDLYHYALEKKVVPDDDDDEEGEEVRKYHHVVYKAHYPELCAGGSHKGVKAWPEGCLLDPKRGSWRDLRQEMANPRNNFAVIYQQEDTDPRNVLVDPMWINGGTDPVTGEVFFGCMDKGRDACELPEGLFGDRLSIVTADPSPTRYWSIQWWVVRCVDGVAEERYLMDIQRRTMDAPSFLDWNNATQSFSGIMEEWQRRSLDLGLPVTYWIIEANAAQRFMLQYEHVRRWLGHWRTNLIPHQTHVNKSDPELGITALKPLYKYGKIRLPSPGARGNIHYQVRNLYEEVTTWPDGRTDDCVMAQWFLEWNLPNLVPRAEPLPRMWRPSWLKKADTYSWREQWRKAN